MANILQKEFFISSFDLNPKGQARLTTMANFFQEMAYHHASQWGFGYDDMNQKQSMWVLSRMRIQMKQYPVWDDCVKVETWHRGMDRLFGLRDFRVSDSSDRILGIASSAWLILDSRSKRPIRQPGDVLTHSQEDQSVFERTLEKIQLPADLEEISTQKVLFSDLDIMGHVNNVKYMEWCIDAAIHESNINLEIRELEINFLHEALLGDEVTIYGLPQTKSEALKNQIFIGKRKGDEQEIFRSRLHID